MTAPAGAAAPLPFIDIGAQRRRLGTRIDTAVARVLEHCGFIMGPEVARLEAELAAFCGARHVITCSSGTDALALVLMAWKIRPGQAVFCPSFTFCATAEVVAWLGASPVFVDVDEATFNMDPASLEAAIATARAKGLEPAAVIPVDLFGLPANHAAIAKIAAREGLRILDDAAQGFGGAIDGRRVGTFGHATATSFFPAKPLGCYGDGGAIFTDDAELADVLRSLRVHGQNLEDKYDNIRIGMAGRLDTVQAAVLIEKLAIFPDEIEARERIARRYNALLGDVVAVPATFEGHVSTWAQYTIRVPAGRRAAIAAALKADGVPTAIYYPIPMHRQTAYKHYPVAANGLPVCDRLAGEVLSLPMHPYLDDATQDRIVASVRRAVAA